MEQPIHQDGRIIVSAHRAHSGDLYLRVRFRGIEDLGARLTINLPLATAHKLFRLLGLGLRSAQGLPPNKGKADKEWTIPGDGP